MIRQKVAVIVGARPNFVKAVGLIRELERNKDSFDYLFINTGQHYDYLMSKVFFEELQIEPHLTLDSARGKYHTDTIANVIRDLTSFFTTYRFDYVIVFGDVNSTLASAIASSKAMTKVIHVESGLRSRDRRMPEEINRVITDHLSDILFTSERSADKNLIEEGIDKEKIYFVGNIMIDALVMNKEKYEILNTYREYGLDKGKYIILTFHRQENVDDYKTLLRICKFIQTISKTFKVLAPLHPRTTSQIKKFELEEYLENVTVIPPQGYLEFINLISNSCGVITDSGGIQEETSFLNIPCITLRDNTERPVTIEQGTNTLLNIFSEGLEEQVTELLRNPKKRKKEIENWDGKTAQRILEVLKKKSIL